MRFLYKFISLGLLILISCTPTTSYYSWVATDHQFDRFDKIAVFGITKDLQDANDFEVTMVNMLRKQGYKTIQGMSVIPPEWMKDLDVKSIRQHLVSKGVEAVLSLTVVDVNSRNVYVAGSVYATPVEYRRFGTNYMTTYRQIYQPGYYTAMSSFIYEAHLYDLTSENINNNLIWTFQFKYDAPIVGIPELTSFSRNLVEALNRDNIL